MIDPNFRMTNALEAFNRTPKGERVRKEKSFDKYIRNTKSPSFAELKKESEDLYNRKVANEDVLIAAADAGTLKSERLKKQANAIKKRREKEAEKAKEASESAKTE